jgi:transcription elongation GreA/GreB family factor
VGVGSIVEVQTGGKKITYTILGAWDGDPEKNVISYKTALASALLGKKVGDVAKVKISGGDEDYTVLSIARYADKNN